MSVDRLTTAQLFASFASRGWTQAALKEFCEQHRISEQQRHAWWPQGVRSLAWDLNAAADEEMRHDWPHGAPSLAAIFHQRFMANENLRASVAQLAKSDLFHPLNTIARTAETARHMLALCRMQPTLWRLSRLTLAYSATVLVWIGDCTEGRMRTARAGQRFLALVGLR